MSTPLPARPDGPTSSDDVRPQQRRRRSPTVTEPSSAFQPPSTDRPKPSPDTVKTSALPVNASRKPSQDPAQASALPGGVTRKPSQDIVRTAAFPGNPNRRFAHDSIQPSLLTGYPMKKYDSGYVSNFAGNIPKRFSHGVAPVTPFTAYNARGARLSLDLFALNKAPSALSFSGNILPDANKKRPLALWPEFTDSDISNEKWEIVHKGKVDKAAKTTSSTQQVQNFFDDPEGKLCELPTCLRVASWKRPKDFMLEKVPVIVDIHDGIHNFDLMSTNDAVHQSELMRYITSQILAIWHQSEIKKNADGTYVVPVPSHPDPNNIQETIYTHLWRPWEHIYAMTKAGKGPNWPLYNPCGKYVVKLYWMGCWRKLIVDDTMPFDENDHLLLPSTSLTHELWPMLLTKALLKVAGLDSGSGRTSTEFGDFSPVHCLRAWLPEIIPLEYEYMEKMWNLLKTTLPEFKLPDLPPAPAEEGKPGEVSGGEPQKDTSAVVANPVKDVKSEKDHDKLTVDKGDAKLTGRESKAAKSTKSSKKDKAEKEDKDKLKEKLVLIEDQPFPDHPEVMIFVSFHGLPKQPTRVTMLSEMADASERLRQHGLSHSYPHPILLTETRSCPLVRPTPPPKSAPWKEVRYWKKKQPTLVSADPVEPLAERPIQSVHLHSPFINHNVTPLEIPADTHRPKSSLSRGSTQASPGHMDAITENEDPAHPAHRAVSRASSAGKQPKHKDPSKVVEDHPKSDTTLKPEKHESKSSRKSRSDHAKDLLPPEVAASPQSPKTEKRAASSKLSKRDTSKNADKEKPSDTRTAVSVSKNMTEEVPASAAADLSASAAAAAHDPGTEENPDAEHQPTEVKTDLWMDFDVLYKCFKTLYIYHKPSTYPHNYPDVKAASQPTSTSERTDKSKGEKKSQLGASAAIPGPILEDKSNMNFLFVDSLQPIEVVVSYSVISHWNDGGQYAPPKEEVKASSVAGTGTGGGTGTPSSALKLGKEKGDRESKAGDASMSVSESSVMGDAGQTVQTVVGAEPVPKDPVQPGLIYAETYSWKRVVAGETSLRLRTTGTRAALLTLPPGRHVLRFYMSSSLGHHHVQLCSTTNFIFGDEEKVMAELTKESCRFTDSALKGIVSLGRCLQNFSDPEKKGMAKNEFIVCNCLYRKDRSTGSLLEHHRAYQEALYTMLRTVFSTPETMNLLTQEMSFAWRVFNFDCTTKNPLNVPPNVTPSRPPTAVTTSDRGSSTGTAKKSTVKKNPVANKVEYWKNREITADDQNAAVKVQTIWRGYFVRKIINARRIGTDDNLKVQEQLQKAWSAIEPNMEQNALLLFRTMFRLSPGLMSKYSFYADEWNRISYADYSGIYPEHGPNSWFLLFREVFMITEEMLCVPKLTASTPYCMLRVVNNDTGEEIPQVFLKVMPHVYKKNKAGYTFVAEAITNSEPMPTGRWRMRLIGSHSPLPAPAPSTRKDVMTSFNVNEMRDYYVPTGQNTIFRYAVKVSETHLVTLQMSTSKPDVYIRLQILNNDEEVAGVEGKGGAVLPAFIFRVDGQSNSERLLRSRSSSRSSTRLEAKSPSNSTLQKAPSQKRTPSAGRSPRATKRSELNSTGSAVDLAATEEEEVEAGGKTHKYVIQAVVLRNGWPLSASQWAFVQGLKDNERNENIANEGKERTTSPVRNEKPSLAVTTPTAKGKAAPKGKAAKDKEKDKQSSTMIALFDASKPHWLLRIVSDGNAADQIEVKKDTEQADAIKAMKKAWEEAEPGRAAKAKQSRLQYLNTHLIKVEDPDEGAAVVADVVEDDSILTTSPPQKKKPTEVIPPLDLTPWIRQTLDEPRNLEEVKAERELEWKREVEAFNARKKEMEEWRERDRLWRNRAKVEQMALFEKRQDERDEYRGKLHEARQAIRQQYLEIERLKMEELAAKEAALQAEKEKNSPSSTKKERGARSKSPASKKKK